MSVDYRCAACREVLTEDQRGADECPHCDRDLIEEAAVPMTDGGSSVREQIPRWAIICSACGEAHHYDARQTQCAECGAFLPDATEEQHDAFTEWYVERSEEYETKRKAKAFDNLWKWRENNPGKPITEQNFHHSLRRAGRQLSTVSSREAHR